jgi:hypothetical protein
MAIAADKFLIDSLKIYCKARIQEMVDERNAWDVLERLVSFNVMDVAQACYPVS